METRGHLLVVEDDLGIQTLVEDLLREEGCTVTTASTAAEAKLLLEKADFDLVLLDYSLPDANALDLIRELAVRGKKHEFLLTTGMGDERVAVQAMKEGARDYVVKDGAFLQLLPRAVERALQEVFTERKLAFSEEALRQSQARFQRIADNVNDVIWILDLRTLRFTYVSPGVERLRGYTPEEVLKEPFEASVTADSYQRLVKLMPLRIEEYFRSGRLKKNFIDRVDQIHRDGRVVHTEAVTSLIEDASGEPAELFGISRDITDRMEMERRLLQNQKLESLGLLAGGIAHDFNNLLSAMMGNLDLALLKLPPESPGRDSIGNAMKAAGRAAALIKQMLVYSGKGMTTAQPIDLSRLVSDSIEMMKVILHQGIRVEIRTREGLPFVLGDLGQLQQLVLNLITNAAEAIGNRGGKITLATGKGLLSSERIREFREGQSVAPGTHVFLEVTDTGCGMEEETKARIFDPFFTTKETGKGLGMAAILGIIRGHHGGIELESAVGEGSLFRVWLPASLDQRGEVSSTPEQACSDSDVSSSEVLVVDDEEVVRKVTAEILDQLGYQPVTAQGGLEALSLLKKSPDRFRAVLLDLTMPDMNGFEVLKEIRNHQCTACVILMSGYSEQKVGLTQVSGYSSFLQKPFRVSELKETLELALLGGFPPH